ncbi:hypothetical protein COBT_001586 [Conglomerata obtusa]
MTQFINEESITAEISLKLARLITLYKQTIPLDHITNHPFVYYSARINGVILELDKLIEQSEKEICFMKQRNESLRKKIKLLIGALGEDEDENNNELNDRCIFSNVKNECSNLNHECSNLKDDFSNANHECSNVKDEKNIKNEAFNTNNFKNEVNNHNSVNTTENFNNQNREGENSNKQIENKIIIDKIINNSNANNLNLEHEILKEQEERINFKINALKAKIISKIKQIITLIEWIGLDYLNEMNKDQKSIIMHLNEEIKTENINITFLKDLIKINLILNKIKDDKEKERIKYYKFIISGYEQLQEETINEIDKQIINNFYDVKIDLLYKKYIEIKTEIENRKNKVIFLLNEIEKLEINLEGHIVTENYEKDISMKNVKYLEEKRLFLQKEEEKHFEIIFNETLNELSEICKVFEMEMVNFDKTKGNLEIMKKIINELKNKKDLFLEIWELIDKRENIKNKMIEFEINASDPKRLFRSSFQLINEERFRKNAVPNLLKIEEKLVEKIKEYEKQFEVFLVKGENFRENIENEIKNRIINKSVFILNKTETPRKGK